MKNIFENFLNKLNSIIPIDFNNLNNIIDKNYLYFPKFDIVTKKMENIEKYSGFVIITDRIFDNDCINFYVREYPKNKKYLITNCKIITENYNPFYWYLWNEKNHVKDLYRIRNLNIQPLKKLYLNFRLHSNYSYNLNKENLIFYKNRFECYNYFVNDNYNCSFDIDFSPIGKNWLVRANNEKYINYYTKICQHYFNCCVVGNGLDSIRMWDTLYCCRIPVVIRNNENEWFYKRLEQLPILFLSKWEDFYIESQKFLDKFNINNYNLELLDLKYYIKKYNFKT